jgi:hypothetical protein
MFFDALEASVSTDDPISAPFLRHPPIGGSKRPQNVFSGILDADRLVACGAVRR